MEKMREMGSVMKGRDDGMESKMGCGVRETSGGKRMEGDGVATGRRRGGESEEGEKKRGVRGRGRPGKEMDVREMESPGMRGMMRWDADG